MAKPLMVLVEPDESYLAPLEIKLAECLWNEADLEVITDTEYCKAYFVLPREIDILIIDETVYTEALVSHNIDKVYVLTEEPPCGSEGGEGLHAVSRIYKYTNLSMIVDAVIPDAWVRKEGGREGTKIAAVISPEGGAGSTTIAVGISAVLHQKHKKVLYINFSMYQSFQFYLKNKSVLPMEACLQMQEDNPQIYEDMQPYIIREGAHYFPPLKMSRESLGIGISAYINLVSRVCLTNDYDYVIADIGNELTASTAAFLKYAKKVYVVEKQTPFSSFKMEVFKRSIDCSDTEKYVFVCNCSQEGGGIGMGECCVERLEEDKPLQAQDLAVSEGIQKLGLLL